MKRSPGSDIDRWRQTVDDLAGQLATAEAELASVAGRRRSLVLPARTGDEDAARGLADQNAELARMQVEVRDLGQALEDARRELAGAEQHAADAARAKDLARAAELDRAAVDLAGQVDQALAAIATALAGMRDALEEADRLHGDGRAMAKRAAPGNLVRGSLWHGALAYHGVAPSEHYCDPRAIRPFAAAFDPAGGGDEPAEAERQAA